MTTARFGIKPAYIEKLDTVRRWNMVLRASNLEISCDYSQFVTSFDMEFTCDEAIADKVEEITLHFFGDYAAELYEIIFVIVTVLLYDELTKEESQ